MGNRNLDSQFLRKLNMTFGDLQQQVETDMNNRGSNLAKIKQIATRPYESEQSIQIFKKFENGLNVLNILKDDQDCQTIDEVEKVQKKILKRYAETRYVHFPLLNSDYQNDISRLELQNWEVLENVKKRFLTTELPEENPQPQIRPQHQPRPQPRSHSGITHVAILGIGIILGLGIAAYTQSCPECPEQSCVFF